MISLRLPNVTVSRTLRRYVLIPLVCVLGSGCAARQNRLAKTFIKPGEPSMTYGEPVKTRPESMQEYVRRVRDLQASARAPRATSFQPTIESQNTALAAALFAVRVRETADTHRAVADAYLQAGVADMALRHLERAVQADRCDAAAYDAMARIWRDWGFFDSALGNAYRARACSPQSPEVENTRGTVLLALGARREARVAFARAAELDPTAAYAWTNLCYVALQDQDAPAAAGLCARALTLDPGLVAAQANFALAYALEGNAAEAERWLSKRADTAAGLYDVGILRLSLRQYDAAALAFDKAVALRPLFRLAEQRAKQARTLAARAAEELQNGHR
jgi:Tfp pilus assembly protein PilF